MSQSPGLEVVSELEGLGKFGFGEMSTPETSVWILRTLFFSYMNKLATVEAEELRSQARPFVADIKVLSKQQLPDDRADIPGVVLEFTTPTSVTRRLHYLDDWRCLKVAATQFTCIAGLTRVLEEWATPRKLASEWFLDAVVLLLWVAPHDQPLSFPGSMMWDKGRRFGGPDWRLYHQLGRAIEPPKLPSYNPLGQDRAEYLAASQKQLQAYCSNVEKILAATGLRNTERKRGRSGPRWLHVEWFVRRRVQQWPLRQIAERYRVTEDVVSKAVRKIARIINRPVIKPQQA